MADALTMAYALSGPSGQPLAAMFTGPAADRMAEAWAAEMYARREEIKAGLAARAAKRPAGRSASEARRRRRQSSGEGGAS